MFIFGLTCRFVVTYCFFFVGSLFPCLFIRRVFALVLFSLIFSFYPVGVRNGYRCSRVAVRAFSFSGFVLFLWFWFFLVC